LHGIARKKITELKERLRNSMPKSDDEQLVDTVRKEGEENLRIARDNVEQRMEVLRQANETLR
jgi:hypothetical protein